MARRAPRTLAALSVVAVLGGCSSTSSGGSVVSDPPEPDPAVVYTLTGSASGADLTYNLGDGGGTEQQQGVDVPLSNSKTGLPGIRFTAPRGTFLYFSAQMTDYGDLTCTILVDGVPIATKTSRGEFAIVTCEGRA